MKPRLGEGRRNRQVGPSSCPRLAGSIQHPPPGPRMESSERGWGGAGCCQRNRRGALALSAEEDTSSVAVKKAGCSLHGQDTWAKAATSWTLGSPFLGSEKGGGCWSHQAGGPPAVGPLWPWPCWDAHDPPAVGEEPPSLLGQKLGVCVLPFLLLGWQESCFVSDRTHPKDWKVPRVLGQSPFGGAWCICPSKQPCWSPPASWAGSLLPGPHLSPPFPHVVCPLVPGGATALVPSAEPGRQAGGPGTSSRPGTNDRLPAGDHSLPQTPGHRGCPGAGEARSVPRGRQGRGGVRVPLSLTARVLIIYLHFSECCFWQVSREEREAARQKQLSGHYRAQQ